MWTGPKYNIQFKSNYDHILNSSQQVPKTSAKTLELTAAKIAQRANCDLDCSKLRLKSPISSWIQDKTLVHWSKIIKLTLHFICYGILTFVINWLSINISCSPTFYKYEKCWIKYALITNHSKKYIWPILLKMTDRLGKVAQQNWVLIFSRTAYLMPHANQKIHVGPFLGWWCDGGATLKGIQLWFMEGAFSILVRTRSAHNARHGFHTTHVQALTMT